MNTTRASHFSGVSDAGKDPAPDERLSGCPAPAGKYIARERGMTSPCHRDEGNTRRRFSRRVLA